MFFQFLIGSLFLCQAILARSIYRDNTQHALLPIEPLQRTTPYPHKKSVLLGYIEHGSFEEKAVEIPLRTRISSGVQLPPYPKTMRVLTATNDKGNSVSLEMLDSIVCRLEPKTTVEAAPRRPWLEFSMQNGMVEFEKSDSKWFLSGAAVAAYECR